MKGVWKEEKQTMTAPHTTPCLTWWLGEGNCAMNKLHIYKKKHTFKNSVAKYVHASAGSQRGSENLTEQQKAEAVTS